MLTRRRWKRRSSTTQLYRVQRKKVRARASERAKEKVKKKFKVAAITAMQVRKNRRLK
jgi:hypothetical protein